MPTIIIRSGGTQSRFSLIKDADIVVIGGGCVGASITYHLARAGAERVVLLEKGHLAWGATGKSSAIVNVGVWNASKPLVKMLLESIEVFHRFDELVGGKCGFTETGWVGLAGQGQEERVKKTADLEAKIGVDTRIVPASKLKEIEPNLFTDDLVAGVYESKSGYANPVETTNSYGTQAEKLGASIITGAKATRLRIEGSRIRGIETEKGYIAANKVVVATNVWSKRLFADLKVELPIDPSRKQVCLFQPSSNSSRPRVVIDDFVNDLYIKPDGSRALVGKIEAPGVSMDPENYSEVVDSDTVSRFAKKLVHRLPSMGSAVSNGGYAGPYDVSPDGHPILDEIPGISGLYCAVGFSGHGFRFSPCTGRLMAEFLLEGKSEGIDIREFRLSRFAEGKPITPLIQK